MPPLQELTRRVPDNARDMAGHVVKRSPAVMIVNMIRSNGISSSSTFASQ
jgi:hypothetical protein